MKAVLVIDMPDGANADDYYVKSALVLHKGDKPFQVDKVAVEFYNYPLKPLPQKLKLRIQSEWITDYDRYEIGYNACLDKILGETE